jgi:hypothetical protein
MSEEEKMRDIAVRMVGAMREAMAICDCQTNAFLCRDCVWRKRGITSIEQAYGSRNRIGDDRKFAYRNLMQRIVDDERMDDTTYEKRREEADDADRGEQEGLAEEGEEGLADREGEEF